MIEKRKGESAIYLKYVKARETSCFKLAIPYKPRKIFHLKRKSYPFRKLQYDFVTIQ